MKAIMSLLAFAMLLIGGCVQTEAPKISYTKLGDATSCMKDLPQPFQEFERKGEESIIIYPKDLIYKIQDMKRCEWIFKGNENKVVIGQVMDVGGCDNFSGEIELKQDEENKKILVTFIKNTAPPGTECLLNLKWINVWIAIDYIDGYTYESQIKTVVKS